LQTLNKEKLTASNWMTWNQNIPSSL
jgi:hypothetical protein